MRALRPSPVSLGRCAYICDMSSFAQCSHWLRWLGCRRTVCNQWGEAMGVALLELGPITDVYVEDVHRIEVFGYNARLIYYRWRLAEDGVTWQRVAADVAIVRPLHTIRTPMSAWPLVTRWEAPLVPVQGVH
jgi:hypothetical protein